MATNRRTLLKAGAGLAATIAAGALGFPYIVRKRRRVEDIYLLVSDAMRGDAIGKVINGSEVTPNLNRLAEGGVFFREAYSAAPATKSSMASVYTGLYPPGHGVECPVYTVPDCETLPRFFSKKGYGTAAVVSNPFLEAEISQKGTRRDVGFGFRAGFDIYHSLPCDDENTVRRKGYKDGEEMNRYVFNFLENYMPTMATGNRPMFMYLHYMDSHQPWLKPSVTPFTGRFHRQDVLKKAGAEALLESDWAIVDKVLFDNKEADEGEKETIAAIYYESCAYADYCIGELLKRLRRAGAYEDAMIVFTADHGEELFEHGRLGHAQNLYNTSLHVPLVIKRRGTGAAEIANRVSNAGIFPTLKELFGESLDYTTVSSFARELQGASGDDRSIVAGLEARYKLIRKDAVTCMGEPSYEKGAEGGYRFFDMSADRGETLQLEVRPAVVHELESEVYHARRIAGEAGIQVTFSTYPWQNPFALTQNKLAEEAIAAGQIAEEDALRLKSQGAFIPQAGADGVDMRKLNREALTPAQARQLKALGYIN